MSHHAGDALHYHDAPPNRYGHRHPFLSIMHEHEDEAIDIDWEAGCWEGTRRDWEREQMDRAAEGGS